MSVAINNSLSDGQADQILEENPDMNLSDVKEHVREKFDEFIEEEILEDE